MLMLKYGLIVTATMLFVAAAATIAIEVYLSWRASRPMSMQWRRAARLGTNDVLESTSLAGLTPRPHER